MKTKENKANTDTYLSDNFEKLSELLVGGGAQNVDHEKWPDQHLHKPHAYRIALCRGESTDLPQPLGHLLLKKAADLWPILKDLLSTTHVSVKSDRCLNRPSSTPLSGVITWGASITIRITGADCNAYMIHQQIRGEDEIDRMAEKITLSHIRSSQRLLSYVKEVS